MKRKIAVALVVLILGAGLCAALFMPAGPVLDSELGEYTVDGFGSWLQENLKNPAVKNEVLSALGQAEARRTAQLTKIARYNVYDYPVHIWVETEGEAGYQMIDFYLGEEGGFCTSHDWVFVREITNIDELKPAVELCVQAAQNKRIVLIEDFAETGGMMWQTVYDVPVGKSLITVAVKVDGDDFAVLKVDELEKMRDSGTLDELKRLTAVYDGAAELVLEGRLSFLPSAKHRFTALGYCNGVYMLLEADGPMDFPELM